MVCMTRLFTFTSERNSFYNFPYIADCIPKLISKISFASDDLISEVGWIFAFLTAKDDISINDLIAESIIEVFPIDDNMRAYFYR